MTGMALCRNAVTVHTGSNFKTMESVANQVIFLKLMSLITRKQTSVTVTVVFLIMTFHKKGVFNSFALKGFSSL